MAVLEEQPRVLASIDGFLLDCLLSDSHAYESDVTEFPVESGSTISDNIRNKPLVVTMDCFVSNSPLGLLDVSAPGPLIGPKPLNTRGNSPPDTALALMLKIRDNRLPVTIRTSLSTYKDMALKSLTIPREGGRGDDLRFTAVFTQIELVTNKREKRVAIVGAKGNGASKVKLVFTPRNDTTLGYVAVDVSRQEWFDEKINCWRVNVEFKGQADQAKPQVRHFAGIAQGAANFAKFAGLTWQLVDGTPELISNKQWASEKQGDHFTTRLSDRIAVLRGEAPFPAAPIRRSPFDSTDKRHQHDHHQIIWIAPSQYTLQRLLP